MLKWLKARRGSATIEATISLTLFIFFIVTIYSVLNFCRTQALVSEAINQTAKELSQYSYFYKMSGLQKYEIALNDQASGTKESIDDMISATDNVYSAIGEGSNTMTGDVNTILQSKNALQAFLASDTAIDNTQNTYADIDTKINDFTNQFKTLFSDPKGLMIGMAAIAGQDSLETAKSRLIAAPLSKLLTEKYFELPNTSADERLRGLGVVDGYDGLNFNLSTIFANGTSDIKITVVYKVKTIQLLPVKSEAWICQTANTRGWLSGDVAPKLMKKIAPDVMVTSSGTSGGTAEAINLWEKSTCSTDELYTYLKNIDSDAAEIFLKEGTWPSKIQIPKNSSALRADGTINWDKAPEGGYVLNSVGKADKNPYTPMKGEIIDRYGPSNGRYTSPVIDGKPYNYDQRALPYLEDSAQYHQYEVVGDFSKLQEYINNCPDVKLKTQIDAAVTKYYDGDYGKLITYKGDIAGIEGWGNGGGIQYEFALTVDQLEQLGLLKEIK